MDGVLCALEQTHLRIVGRKRGKGAKIALAQEVSSLHALMQDAPGRLTIEEQAAWVAGYYQQREHDFARHNSGATNKDTSFGADAPKRLTRMTDHLDPTVKHDALFVFDAIDSNPNGDPDNGGRPRTDLDTGRGSCRTRASSGRSATVSSFK